MSWAATVLGVVAWGWARRLGRAGSEVWPGLLFEGRCPGARLLPRLRISTSARLGLGVKRARQRACRARVRRWRNAGVSLMVGRHVLGARWPGPSYATGPTSHPRGGQSTRTPCAGGSHLGVITLSAPGERASHAPARPMRHPRAVMYSLYARSVFPRPAAPAPAAYRCGANRSTSAWVGGSHPSRVQLIAAARAARCNSPATSASHSPAIAARDSAPACHSPANRVA